MKCENLELLISMNAIGFKKCPFGHTCYSTNCRLIPALDLADRPKILKEDLKQEAILCILEVQHENLS